ncbi:unnamed protein product [Effrenium voratum]|uniref:Uncharacterized protein n=1 Tax=Effrenium voratum TaxID=2562239 RepID=A0AA36HW70_9DINO|nr:unnamed protein product [Effrenium voratum]
MIQPEVLAAMPAKQYLEHFHLDFYLSEAVSLEGPSAPELLREFWQGVLDGSRLQSKGVAYFRTAVATPENRRAFVALMRQRLSRVVPDPETLAVTPLDFHDMLVFVCPDFPLSLVIDAAEFAQRADRDGYRVLGQMAGGGRHVAAALDAGEVLSPLADLQRMVECRLVYAEVLEAVRSLYSCKGDDCQVPLTRLSVVTHLRELFNGMSIPLGAATPSSRALQQFLQGSCTVEGCLAQLTLHEAVREVAKHFELVPPPIPDCLLKAPPAEEPQASEAEEREGPEDKETEKEKEATTEAAEALGRTFQGGARPRPPERRRFERSASGSMLRARSGRP